MLSAIRQFFEEQLTPVAGETEVSTSNRIQLATAALLFEVLKTDAHIDERETDTLHTVLRRTFALDDEALTKIIELAEAESHQATSLYEFTSLINEQFDYAQKTRLIENMWRLAFADQVLDKYEEHLIRRTADLLYVSHSDFIKTKLNAKT